MSLSARRVLHSACHISVLPSRRSTVATEPAFGDEHVEHTMSSVSRTSPLQHLLINGAERSLDQYVDVLWRLLVFRRLFSCFF